MAPSLVAEILARVSSTRIIQSRDLLFQCQEYSTSDRYDALDAMQRKAHETIIPFPRYPRAFELNADCSNVYNIGS